jgi:hypothetical protein
MPDDRGEADEPDVTQYLTGSDRRAEPVARQLSEALGVGLDEITAALKAVGSWRPAAALSGEGSLTAGGIIVPGVALSGEGSVTVGGPAGIIRVAALAGEVVVSGAGAAVESLSVV